MPQSHPADPAADSIPSRPGPDLAALAWLVMETLDGVAAAVLPGGTSGATAPAWAGPLTGPDALALIEACRRHPVLPGEAASFDPGLSGAAGPGRAMTAALVDGTGEHLGRLCVLLRPGADGPGPSARRTMALLAGMIANEIDRGRRDAEAAAALERAGRRQRMLQMVAEAGSIADALTNMLRELCTHHRALVGRIWRMNVPGDMLQEVSRFNGDDLDAQSYYRQPPAVPMIWGNSFTADAIRRNQPRSMLYDEIERPERYVLLRAAMQSGLKCQVSYPIWVQDERFGISLAFNTRRGDLQEVVADIDALADAIRPALLRKVTEDRIRFLAHHDDLTQLANRPRFQECLAQAVAAAACGAHGLGLLYVDLDGFKRINDTRGHAIGDKLLAAVAGRLGRAIRAEDTVARIGGDEFAIIQAHDDQPRSALHLAARLVEAFATPFEIEGHLVLAGCSVGIAAYPEQGDTPDLLLRNADTALYCAKATGRNGYRLFEPTMDTPLRERALIEGEMAGALARSEFTLAFQPLCDAGTLGTIGFEALLRWTHPERGPVAPEVFIPIAEASGLILPLGQWALEAACAEAARWEPPVRLAVNLSPLQFREPDLPGRVAAALARGGLAPDRLDLEVTEGLLLDDAGLVLDTMRALRAQGVGMTLDDFGTAYASLSYLRRFPFDRIKIDKSFIDHITGDEETFAIVQTILALSERLSLSVVAEGVETPEQLDTLRGLGCRIVQGYLTGRPMPGADVPAYLARMPA